jgi:4'-phosphopantetheinyl transferase EntD
VTVAEAAARLGSELGAALAVVPVGGSDRRAQRAAGLDAARQAFARSGADGLEVLGHEPDGRPRWPSGWTGSISHTGSYAVAAVTRTQERAGIGIDIEATGALDSADAALVLDPDERAAVDSATDPSALATLIWSAKEAAFKAWATAGGGLHGIDPVEIHVDVDLVRRVIDVRPTGQLAIEHAAATPLTGSFTTIDDFTIVLVADGN